jgi:hypothetical protein
MFRRAYPSLAVAMTVVVTLAAGATALAQEDADVQNATSADPPQLVTDPDAIPPAPPSFQLADSPRLACGVRAAPVRTNGASSATFTCWVAGAPAGDTHFSVEAARLVDGGGACGGRSRTQPGRR